MSVMIKKIRESTLWSLLCLVSLCVLAKTTLVFGDDKCVVDAEKSYCVDSETPCCRAKMVVNSNALLLKDKQEMFSNRRFDLEDILKDQLGSDETFCLDFNGSSLVSDESGHYNCQHFKSPKSQDIVARLVKCVDDSDLPAKCLQFAPSTDSGSINSLEIIRYIKRFNIFVKKDQEVMRQYVVDIEDQAVGEEVFAKDVHLSVDLASIKSKSTGSDLVACLNKKDLILNPSIDLDDRMSTIKFCKGFPDLNDKYKKTWCDGRDKCIKEKKKETDSDRDSDYYKDILPWIDFITEDQYITEDQDKKCPTFSFSVLSKQLDPRFVTSLPYFAFKVAQADFNPHGKSRDAVHRSLCQNSNIPIDVDGQKIDVVDSASSYGTTLSTMHLYPNVIDPTYVQISLPIEETMVFEVMSTLDFEIDVVKIDLNNHNWSAFKDAMVKVMNPVSSCNAGSLTTCIPNGEGHPLATFLSNFKERDSTPETHPIIRQIGKQLKIVGNKTREKSDVGVDAYIIKLSSKPQTSVGSKTVEMSNKTSFKPFVTYLPVFQLKLPLKDLTADDEIESWTKRSDAYATIRSQTSKRLLTVLQGPDEDKSGWKNIPGGYLEYDEKDRYFLRDFGRDVSGTHSFENLLTLPNNKTVSSHVFPFKMKEDVVYLRKTIRNKTELSQSAGYCTEMRPSDNNFNSQFTISTSEKLQAQHRYQLSTQLELASDGSTCVGESTKHTKSTGSSSEIGIEGENKEEGAKGSASVSSGSENSVSSSTGDDRCDTGSGSGTVDDDSSGDVTQAISTDSDINLTFQELYHQLQSSLVQNIEVFDSGTKQFVSLVAHLPFETSKFGSTAASFKKEAKQLITDISDLKDAVTTMTQNIEATVKKNEMPMPFLNIKFEELQDSDTLSIYTCQLEKTNQTDATIYGYGYSEYPLKTDTDFKTGMALSEFMKTYEKIYLDDESTVSGLIEDVVDRCENKNSNFQDVCSAIRSHVERFLKSISPKDEDETVITDSTTLKQMIDKKKTIHFIPGLDYQASFKGSTQKYHQASFTGVFMAPPDDDKLSEYVKDWSEPGEILFWDSTFWDSKNKEEYDEYNRPKPPSEQSTGWSNCANLERYDPFHRKRAVQFFSSYMKALFVPNTYCGSLTFGLGLFYPCLGYSCCKACKSRYDYVYNKFSYEMLSGWVFQRVEPYSTDGFLQKKLKRVQSSLGDYDKWLPTIYGQFLPITKKKLTSITFRDTWLEDEEPNLSWIFYGTTNKNNLYCGDKSTLLQSISSASSGLAPSPFKNFSDGDYNEDQIKDTLKDQYPRYYKLNAKSYSSYSQLAKNVVSLYNSEDGLPTFRPENWVKAVGDWVSNLFKAVKESSEFDRIDQQIAALTFTNAYSLSPNTFTEKSAASKLAEGIKLVPSGRRVDFSGTPIIAPYFNFDVMLPCEDNNKHLAQVFKRSVYSATSVSSEGFCLSTLKPSSPAQLFCFAKETQQECENYKKDDLHDIGRDGVCQWNKFGQSCVFKKEKDDTMKNQNIEECYNNQKACLSSTSVVQRTTTSEDPSSEDPSYVGISIYYQPIKGSERPKVTKCHIGDY